MLTLAELADRLKREEETWLVELLDLRSEDIVNRFEDRIEELYDVLVQEYDNSEYQEEIKELTGELNFEDGHGYSWVDEET